MSSPRRNEPPPGFSLEHLAAAVFEHPDGRAAVKLPEDMGRAIGCTLAMVSALQEVWTRYLANQAKKIQVAGLHEMPRPPVAH